MHEKFFLENRLRKDDLTSKCCTLPDQWIACFFGIDGSAFWVLLVEIPSYAVSTEEPGAVGVVRFTWVFPGRDFCPVTLSRCRRAA